ncbi:hypothetical protein EV183_003596 [Coemansia sp. RSA 2336]|nr:hypothetical protein EV183_003596 [Coemansia sp. RSA 2336]
MTTSDPDLHGASSGSGSGNDTDSSTEVSNYIASLHLERANTRVGQQSLIQRRKTLMKQAQDPEADQKALEREIRQIERLASLLGRRQTRFDRKRGAPKVNHDLDATLEGFFNVEDNERIGDILLSANQAPDKDDIDDELLDPELKGSNIQQASPALLAQEHQSANYQHENDPFDRIDEMNIDNSPSGSAEYLPLDTYKGQSITVAEAPADDHARQGGKKVGADEIEEEDEENELHRSQTWKQQSMVLIKEREQFGPALPKSETSEDLCEDDRDQQSENNGKSGEGPQGEPEGAAAAPAKEAPAQQNAELTRKLTQIRAKLAARAQASLSQTGDSDDESDENPVSDTPRSLNVENTQSVPIEPPVKAVVDEYMDILDFIDAAKQSDNGSDDGHVSSDLLDNSSSSESELVFSSHSGTSDSDSDSHYLSRLIPQRQLTVANTADATSTHSHPTDHEPLADDSDNVQSGASGSRPSSVLESAAAATAGVLSSRSTLRRNRRVMARGRTLRNSPLASSTESSAASQHQLPTAGLAQLASNAIEESQQQARGRMRRMQPLLAAAEKHKPLPPIPDRISRVLEVADAKATARSAPPLPTRERPRLPRVLAEDGLGTRAELTAARERPSSMRLFGGPRSSDPQGPPPGSPRTLQRPSTAQSAEVQDEPAMGLREWLERTDMLLPSNNHVSKLLPFPPSISGKKQPTFVSYHYQPAADTANPSRTASGRVVRKVSVFPPAAARPSSASSSIRSSTSAKHNSLISSNSPANSARNSIASATSLPATSQAPPRTCSPLTAPLQGSGSRSHTPVADNTAQQPTEHSAVADAETALYTPVTSQSGPQPAVQPSKALPVVPPLGAMPTVSGSYSPLSAMSGPTVLSAPPGADVGLESSMIEPSAPMMVEPSAPELPAEWDGAPSFSFPTPVHYAPSGAEPTSPHDIMGFVMPHAIPQQYPPPAYANPPAPPSKQPPKLPDKPRPYQPDVIDLSAATSASVPATTVFSPSSEYIMVENEDDAAEAEKAQLNAIADNHSSAVPSCQDSARPSRSSSVGKLEGAVLPAPSELSVVTQINRLETIEDSPQTSHIDSKGGVDDKARNMLEEERQREGKRKAALFELIDTERTYTDDLRMVVELFLLPIQLLGNRKIVDVIFGEMVKITEMNGKMYFDMITRLGPLACLVDPKRAGRNRRKKKHALKTAASPHVGHSRSVLQGSSIRSPAMPGTPSVSVSASNTMSRRLSSSGDPPYPSPRASIYSYDTAPESTALNRVGSRNEDRVNSDDMSIRTSNSGGSNADTIGVRGLFTSSAERQDSVRSRDSVPEEDEYDEDDASKWTEDQVLDYFKNVCIGDVMASYLKDFSEHYALYSANHDKAIEYLKLVRESSSRLNLRNDATRDAHQKLLLTLEQAEKDNRVRRLRLESFLLAPVQRVMRYPLLLEALLKYTPVNHPDHEDVALALSIAGSVATEVDRKSEELMNRQRLAELQSTFDWAHLLGGVQLKLDTFTKLVGQRKFVRKGPLRKASSGKHLYAILFNDFMMITVSDRRGGVWCYEPYRLPIQTYDLLARNPVKDQFELVNLKSGEVLQLRADTAGEAGDWVKDIMKTANYCYEVMCEALRSGIQVSKVKSVISAEARNKILLGSKPTAIGKRH